MLGKVPPCSTLLSPSPHLPHGACLPHPAASIVLVLPLPPLCPGDLNYFGWGIEYVKIHKCEKPPFLLFPFSSQILSVKYHETR